MPTVFQPLESPQFRKYFGAAVLSALGDGMQMIAMSWFLYQRTGSVASISLVFVVQTLPGLLLSPLAGALVDRSRPQWTCVAADVVQGLVLCALVLAIYVDQWVLPAIYLASLLMAVCRLFSLPALGALVRDISTRESLLSANILSSTTLQIGMLCGASAGGFLVAQIGAMNVILANAMSFFVSAVFIAWVRVQAREPRAPAATGVPLTQELREALVYARRHPFILWLTLVDIFDTMAINMFNALLPAFVSRELGGGPQDFGLIEGAWGGGALLGGILLSYVVRRVDQHRISVAGPACLSVLILFFLAAQTTAHAMAGYFVLGIFVCAVGINTNALLAAEVKPAYFGKIKSFIYMCTSYAGLAVYGILSLVGDRVSPRWIFASVSALVMTGFLWKLWRFWRARQAQTGTAEAAAPTE